MKPKVEVYCDINSRTKDHPRHRVLMFMYDGTTIELDQRLVVWWDGTIGYIDEIKTPMGYDPEWASALKTVIGYVNWFVGKSRPHWEKHVTDTNHWLKSVDAHISIHLGCSPAVIGEAQAKKKELEEAILLAVREVLTTPTEIHLDDLSIFHRG